jgi:hypothetical protein
VVNAHLNFLLRVKQMSMIVHAQDRRYTKTPVRGNVFKRVTL